MIRLYFHPTPNPAKIALMLEEIGLPYEIVTIDTRHGEQHTAAFRSINPNGKVPAIVDPEGPHEASATVFDSTAILLYLAEKTGRFLGAPEFRAELLSWLLFVASGLGPFSGQAVHFQHFAPEQVPYAINRFRREAERHYRVLEERLEDRDYFIGNEYTIVDISVWGWIDRAPFIFGGDDPLASYPNLKRWFAMVEARPATMRARQVGTDHPFKREMDDEARRALFPSNYPAAA